MTEDVIPSAGMTTSSGTILNPGDTLTVVSGGVAVETVDSGRETATGGGILAGEVVTGLGFAGPQGVLAAPGCSRIHAVCQVPLQNQP